MPPHIPTQLLLGTSEWQLRDVGYCLAPPAAVGGASVDQRRGRSRPPTDAEVSERASLAAHFEERVPTRRRRPRRDLSPGLRRSGRQRRTNRAGDP